MENYFASKMAVKSDEELRHLIENKETYQEDAIIAAIEELEKRKLSSQDLLTQKDELTAQKENRKYEEELEEGERKRSFKETLQLLMPNKDYLFTPIIIYLNILIFVLMAISGVHPISPSVESLINWGGNLREITLGGQPWRLFTSVFLHGGLFHLLLNMYALLHIGGLLESKFGKSNYLFVYISTGIFASIASICINDNIVSIGASGAIFGMYGLFLSMLFLKTLDIPQAHRKNLLSSILFFIGYNLFYGFTAEGIDNAAHIGGLVSGIIIGLLYYPSFKQPNLSKYIAIGISVILISTILILPNFFSKKLQEFRTVMQEFGIIEEKALWVYQLDLSHIPEDKIQYYYDRLQNEGIDLWEDNLELLGTLSDLPPHLQTRINSLEEYCQLRIQSYELIRELIVFNKPSDLEKINEINEEIEKIINHLSALNE